jgi:hypothetical protein
MKEAYYQLSQEKRKYLWDQLKKALEEAGGKTIAHCHTRWSTHQWRFFVLDQFPDIQAVQKFTEVQEELDFFRYVDSISLLGTEH